jgi:glucose-1-phosphate adenylyltransferase
MREVISVILGGGQGKRLFPLTKDRSKPAVPIGGKYRLIDIPITNCLRSNFNRIFVLTQFNSESLNKHIIQTYRFDNFHRGFVNILAAEQSVENTDWFQGTADAVRKNLKHILAFKEAKYVLILSGDQIYKMDYRKLFEYHIENNLEISISVKPVNQEEAHSFGIMKVNKSLITDFIEKPTNDELLSSFNSYEAVKKNFPEIQDKKEYFASMGIYLFNVEVLQDVLNNSFTDFGKEIIPYSIEHKKVGAFFFNGYWEDVGTIKTFLNANLDFASPLPEFNLYENFIYTHARYLPPSKLQDCHIENSIISEGSIIQNATIKNSVIGIRSIIKSQVIIENSIIMGADYYEKAKDIKENKMNDLNNICIGENTTIKNAIIDKNSRIGKNCIITNKDNKETYDADNYFIRNSIVIIPKNSVIEDNTEI